MAPKDTWSKDQRLNIQTGEARLRELMSQAHEWASGPNKDQEWTNTLLPSLQLASTSLKDPKHPSCTFTFQIHPQHTNRLGNLHGGAIATLFDFCTSCALSLVSKPGFWHYLGVSRTLNTTYLRPAVGGTTVKIECEIIQIGKRICTLRGTMRRIEDDVVLAVCEHGKVNTDPEVSKV
ncbi:putative thioesterase superfamily member [Cladorrhinum sp. PSN259]|nr:putative thioesterase superfamily member [Cladorrhinum sp. PSN259]